MLDESATLHGIPDNEPYFGTAGSGAAGLGTAGSGAAGLGAAGVGSGTSGPGGVGPASVGSSGEPFAVQPVHDGADPFPVMRETRPAEPRRIGWIIAGSVVAALLVDCAASAARVVAARNRQVYLPRSQTLYAKACAQLGCAGRAAARHRRFADRDRPDCGRSTARTSSN